MEAASESSHPRGPVRTIGLALGPLCFGALLLAADLEPGSPAVTRTAAIAIWMAIWWITEAVPLAVTALLPLVLFPLLGVQSGKAVSNSYINWIIFLFIGGFLIALAMQRWNLHRRIALNVLLMAGAKPRNILLGFMAATGFLSMWISNTACAMMMVPIALAVILNLEELVGWKSVSRFSAGLLLSIAYSASIMGIATLVGTPPNLVLVGIYETQFPDADPITFTQWFMFGLPLGLIMMAGLAVYLVYRFCPRSSELQIDKEVILREHRALGPMRFEEKVVLIIFVATALLWLSRADIDLGDFTIKGWGRLFKESEYLNDGTVAIAMALLLFLIPSRKKGATRILDIDVFNKLPWGIVLLFGGGFALASGFEASGLSVWVGSKLQGLSTLPPIMLVMLICLIVTFLTELTSNTASAQILLPILANVAVALDLDPLLLMVPATVSCSCAFMLPVATPPNAIVFGSERLDMMDMVKTGFLLNIFGVIVVTLLTWWPGRMIFGIE